MSMLAYESNAYVWNKAVDAILKRYAANLEINLFENLLFFN